MKNFIEDILVGVGLVLKAILMTIITFITLVLILFLILLVFSSSYFVVIILVGSVATIIYQNNKKQRKKRKEDTYRILLMYRCNDLESKYILDELMKNHIK